MPELLTESFCERCGTRYTFETPQPQHGGSGRLKQARALARGLRNYVLDDELPLDAALADARRDDDRARAEQQLEAFHQAFNFCMDCRQYTCLECWNEAEGRCLSCAPRPGLLDLTKLRGGSEGAGSEADALPPSTVAPIELEPSVLAALTAEPTNGTAPEPSLREAIEALAQPPEVEEPTLAAAAAVPETVVEPDAPSGPPPVDLPSVDLPPIAPLAATTEPSANGPFAIAPPVAPVEPPASEPLAASAEPSVPEPLAASAEPSVPAPLASQPLPTNGISLFPQPRPIGPLAPPAEPPVAPAAWPPAVPVAHDRPPVPLRPPAVPPPAPPKAAPWPPLGAPLEGGPAWPSGPSPLAPPDRLTTLPAATAEAALGPWEASAAQLTARSAGATVQACVSCGLALSATARFCRRCGSRQAA